MHINDITEVATKSNPLRVETHWIAGKKQNLEVYQIPIEYLYFNIENGRYADRMSRLRGENPAVQIDAPEDRWKDKIELMLAGEHKDTASDKAPFERLIEDIRNREQLRPGVVLRDGGVIDGNRRLAALRRLNRETRNKFRHFDGVILPKDTTKEDRWRIEAGLQLGINERLSYSPINELLKVREGVRMYEQMRQQGKLQKEQSPLALVAQAIYGKSEAAIEEMVDRLDLIDEFLEFGGQKGAYDRIGRERVSEDFLEAARTIRAAENQSQDPSFVLKLKSVLFYQIRCKQMSNLDIRQVYDALGGDPKKKGPKPKRVNSSALNKFLGAFPDPRLIRDDLIARTQPPPSTAAQGKPGASAGQPARPKIDVSKAQGATESFLSTMRAANKAKPARQVAEGAAATLEALENDLADKSATQKIEIEDRSAILEAIGRINQSVEKCLGYLK